MDKIVNFISSDKKNIKYLFYIILKMIATNLVKKEEGSKISNVLSNFKRLKLKINKDEIKKFQSKIKYLLTESENKNIDIFLNVNCKLICNTLF